MPTFAAPGFLLAGAVASLLVVALHLLSWRRPTPTSLPTARFAPPSAVRVVSRDLRLRDVLLLVVRSAVLLLAGAAMARPWLAPGRSGRAVIVLADASRRVGSMSEVRDSARARTAGARQVLWVRVDSAARLVSDSAVGERAEVRGRLAAGMVVAVREAIRQAQRHNVVEIVVVSPFARESWDSGVEAVRALWPGLVVPVRVALRFDSLRPPVAPSQPGAPRLAMERDPVDAAVALAFGAQPSTVRVVRDTPSLADTLWARRGGIVVWWPRLAAASSPAPGGGGADDAPRAVAAVTVVTSRGRSVAGVFAPMPVAGSGATAIARWGDGSVAATETSEGAGCLRSVGIDVSPVGDAALRPSFIQFVRTLAAPCGGGEGGALDAATVSAWAEQRPSATAATNGATPGGVVAPASERRGVSPAVPTPAPSAGAGQVTLTRWLLLVVALLLLVEWRLRVAPLHDGAMSRLAPRDRSREAA